MGGVARVHACGRVVDHARVVEKFDAAVVIGRHQVLLACAAVEGVDVGAIRLWMLDTHDREAQHARVGGVVHVAKQLGVDDLLARACVPVQHLVVVGVGHERLRVVVPVDAAHRRAVAGAARDALVAAVDLIDVDLMSTQASYVATAM